MPKFNLTVDQIHDFQSMNSAFHDLAMNTLTTEPLATNRDKISTTESSVNCIHNKYIFISIIDTEILEVNFFAFGWFA